MFAPRPLFLAVLFVLDTFHYSTPRLMQPQNAARESKASVGRTLMPPVGSMPDANPSSRSFSCRNPVPSINQETPASDEELYCNILLAPVIPSVKSLGTI